MIHRTTCNNCGSLLEYDSTSTHEIILKESDTNDNYTNI